MAFIPGSYARAAGLQSEINKVTVTRVAGSEMQYRRTINTYRKDMCMNINNIKREQRKLKQSMVKYSKKLRQSKKEREKRKKKELDESRDLSIDVLILNTDDTLPNVTSKSDDNFNEEIETELNTKSDVFSADISLYKSADTLQNSDTEVDAMDTENTEHQENIDESIHEYSEITEELSKERFLKVGKVSKHKVDSSQNELHVKGAAYSGNTSCTPLQSIPEGLENDVEAGQIEAVNSLKVSAKADVDILVDDCSFPLQKKRKQFVSFADLIKLQHSSSSTKKLFHLVDRLARRHGIVEAAATADKLPDTRDHVHFRGESPAMASSIARTAAVFYPINYGYDTPVESSQSLLDSSLPLISPKIDDRSLRSQNSSKTEISTRKRDSLDGKPLKTAGIHFDDESAFWEKVRQTLKSQRVHQPTQRGQARSKGTLSLPVLVKEVTRIKSVGMPLESEPPAVGQYKTRNRVKSWTNGSRTQRRLPSLLRESNVRSPFLDEVDNKTVDWQSAFGRLKIVHTLVDLTDYF